MSIGNLYYVVQVKNIDFIPKPTPDNPNPERIRMNKVAYLGEVDSPAQRRNILGKEIYTANAPADLFDNLTQQNAKIPGKFYIEFGMKKDAKGGASLFVQNMTQDGVPVNEQPK